LPVILTRTNGQKNRRYVGLIASIKFNLRVVFLPKTSRIFGKMLEKHSAAKNSVRRKFKRAGRYFLK
jgi:hypothetical protein